MNTVVNYVTTLIKPFPRFSLNIAQICTTPVLSRKKPRFVEKPSPGLGIAYRRIVHYPKEYTVQPLDVTNLAGRDPLSGRLVAKGIGGGIKHKFHWIDWHRKGPTEGPPQLEKVLQVFSCGCRTADVALVAVGDKLKYILATQNMKAGDIIKTSQHIPRIPVRANEGDAYPLGALPMETIVHCVEKFPGSGGYYGHSAGNFLSIKKHVDGRIIVQLPSKHQVALQPECMATVGRLSNIMHGKTHIGSAQRNRELGNRPRSGLWQRKTGKHGRKIRALPPIKFLHSPTKDRQEFIRCTLDSINN